MFLCRVLNLGSEAIAGSEGYVAIVAGFNYSEEGGQKIVHILGHILDREQRALKHRHVKSVFTPSPRRSSIALCRLRGKLGECDRLQ